MSEKTPKEKALIMALGEKERFKATQVNSEDAKQTANRERLAKLRIKVEAFCVSKNCSWMVEFLDDKNMLESEFTFHVPGHQTIKLCFGGENAGGRWVVGGGVAAPRKYDVLGEALLAAEERK